MVVHTILAHSVLTEVECGCLLCFSSEMRVERPSRLVCIRFQSWSADLEFKHTLSDCEAPLLSPKPGHHLFIRRKDINRAVNFHDGVGLEKHNGESQQWVELGCHSFWTSFQPWTLEGHTSNLGCSSGPGGCALEAVQW